MRIEGRPYTTIERTLVQRMTEVILQDMCQAFEPLAPVNFTLDRLETNPRFAAIARPANAAILVKLRIDMEDRGGRTELLLPYATLEPIRKLLLQQFMGEKFGRDSIWESHLASELWSTKVDINAILDEQTMSLNKIMNLNVGDTVMLNASPDSKIELRCGNVPLLRGRMGRVGSSVAVAWTKRSNAQMPAAASNGENAMNLTLVVELILTGLLAATLFYCIVLERKLAALRSGQDGLKKTLASLNGAVAAAGTSMHALKSAANEITETLDSRLTHARGLADELGVLCTSGERIAERFDREISSSL